MMVPGLLLAVFYLQWRLTTPRRKQPTADLAPSLLQHVQLPHVAE